MYLEGDPSLHHCLQISIILDKTDQTLYFVLDSTPKCDSKMDREMLE